MKFAKEGVDRSVDKLLTACYDVTIKFYQHHVIKRVTHAVDMGHVPDATNVLNVFCSWYSVISAVSQT